MFKIKLEVSSKEMEETLLAMGFKVFIQTNENILTYLQSIHGMGAEAVIMQETENISRCANKFVQDGKKGPILGPLERVFEVLYKRAIINLMKEY